MGISMFFGIWLLLCQLLDAANDSCGGFLSQPSGLIFSPNYPENYPNNIKCFWDIEVSNNYLVTIVFQDVQLEKSCYYDYIEIYDGPYQTTPKMKRICGDDRDSFTSTSNFISVHFISSSGTSRRGFQAQYYSTPSNNGTSLICSPEQMTATFSKNYLHLMGYTSWKFALYNSSCLAAENSSHVTVEIPYDSCGTIKTTNSDTINYSNILTVNQTSLQGHVITRNENLHLHVSCKMLKNTWVETMFATNGSFEINEIQYSNFHVEMSFFESSSFVSAVNSTPYYVYLNQKVYIKAEIVHPDSNLVLFLDTCKASPSPHDFTTLTYDLIRKGCVKDNTYTTYYSPSPSQVRFGFRSFAFLERHRSVYLRCKMVVCKAFDYSSRCYKFCIERSKRDTSSYEEQMDTVLGPFQLKKDEAKDGGNLAVADVEGQSEYNDASQPLAAAVGVFLVVVVVFGAFVLKKRRKAAMERLLTYKV